MRKEELKIGEYYYCEWISGGKQSSIVKILNISDEKNMEIEVNIIHLSLKKIVGKHRWNINTTNFKRLATPEEIYWYKLCERGGKYVDKPVFKYKLGEKVMYKGEECEIVELYTDGSFSEYIVTYSKGWTGSDNDFDERSDREIFLSDLGIEEEDLSKEYILGKLVDNILNTLTDNKPKQKDPAITILNPKITPTKNCLQCNDIEVTILKVPKKEQRLIKVNITI